MEVNLVLSGSHCHAVAIDTGRGVTNSHRQRLIKEALARQWWRENRHGPRWLMVAGCYLGFWPLQLKYWLFYQKSIEGLEIPNVWIRLMYRTKISKLYKKISQSFKKWKASYRYPAYKVCIRYAVYRSKSLNEAYILIYIYKFYILRRSITFQNTCKISKRFLYILMYTLYSR